MLTGCRPSEAIAATWSEFNFETGEWKKPSAHTKSRKTHRVPLAPAAVELVAQARKAVPEDCPYLFPGRLTKAKGWQPIKQYREAWVWIRDKAKLEPDEEGRLARVYDLRHSFASIGAGQGLSLLIIGKLLGHTQARTTERYAHIPDDPLRQAAEKITGAIANAGKATHNVVPLKGGRGS
jgi:integrase